MLSAVGGGASPALEYELNWCLASKGQSLTAASEWRSLADTVLIRWPRSHHRGKSWGYVAPAPVSLCL